jgi:hypothetical protein
MRISEINEMGRRSQRHEDMVVPRIVEEILKRIAGYLEENFEDVDTDILEKVRREFDENSGSTWYGNWGSEEYNMIPSSSNRRGCTELLITFCSKNDSFENRIIESLDHASTHCKNTRDIYFFTSKWNTSTIDKLRGYIELVKRASVNIVFIYVGKEGFVQMPE